MGAALRQNQTGSLSDRYAATSDPADAMRNQDKAFGNRLIGGLLVGHQFAAFRFLEQTIMD
jgi:hypothetical protein